MSELTPIAQVQAALTYALEVEAKPVPFSWSVSPRAAVAHNLWHAAFIAPLEAAAADWPERDDWTSELDRMVWPETHAHAISLAVALLAQKNGEHA